MSQGSLRDVVNDLREHGVAAGREAGRLELVEARSQAAALVEAARLEASQIVAAAEAEAKRREARLEVELRLAAAAGVSAFRQSLEGALLVPPVERAVGSLFDDPQWLTELLVEATRALAAGRATGVDLEVLVAEHHRVALEGALLREVQETLGDGVPVRFDGGVADGFHVVLVDRAYRYEFTREVLVELLSQWLAPGLRRHLFEGV